MEEVQEGRVIEPRFDVSLSWLLVHTVDEHLAEHIKLQLLYSHRV